jgi:hypothetical protein
MNRTRPIAPHKPYRGYALDIALSGELETSGGVSLKTILGFVGDIPPEDIILEIEKENGYYDEVYVKLIVRHKVLHTEESFAADLEKYNRDMEKYKEDLREYDAWLKVKQEEDELKNYERLKRKFEYK